MGWSGLVLEASWGHLGLSWGVLGPIWRRLEGVWGRLGRSLIALLVEFCHFTENVYFAYVFQCFLMSWACPGGVLEASWRRFGGSGIVSGASWGRLGVSQGRFGSVLKASGCVSADL